MKACELCKSKARIYCDSDQASLCWHCDAKVHSANFLVARHSRSLLCHVCQSPTLWNASGEKLGRTISVCERCVAGSDGREENQGGNDDEIDADDDYDEEEEEEDSSDDVDEDGDNQVVPWSDTSPPPAASLSSSEQSSSRFYNGNRDISLKRLHENALDLCSEDDLDCTSSHKNIGTPSPGAAAARSTGSGEAAFVDSLPLRPLKSRRIEANQSARARHGPAGSRSEAIVETTRRFHLNSGNGICNDRRTVDFDSSVSS